LSLADQESIGIRLKLPHEVTLHEPVRLEIEVENRSYDKVYL
jgi:hypothetical protein